MNVASPFPASSGVAIVGLAGRFPGAESIEQFWCNLRDGVESISFLSDRDLEAAGVKVQRRLDQRYIRAAATIQGVELFDAAFFEMSAREAQITDPQHRLFLECAWHALEDAGCDPRRYPGNIGVFAGAGRNAYFLRNVYGNQPIDETLEDYQLIIGSDNDYLATRVAFKLDLRGPAVTVQTACSTSLVAVHMACRSLLTGECNLAIAGGASVRVPQNAGYLYKESGPSSPDGHTRPFDVNARGGVFGSGIGVVVLKPLECAIADGDPIRAVIKGSAINNDGASKNGFTAPSAAGQATAIRNALAAGGVDPLTISYVEAHGTGTLKGDPIEIEAIKLALRRGRNADRPCTVGSVKGNVGHLDAAAGITGLIKTVLALENEALPGTVNFEQSNPACGLEGGPFFVSSQLTPWKRGAQPRRAGVTSLGFGGTNAHVVLEEAPQPAARRKSARPSHLLVISAKTGSALERATSNLAEFLRKNPNVDLTSLAFTLQTGRAEFPVRRMAVCESVADAVEALESRNSERVRNASSPARRRPLTFLFGGYGLSEAKIVRELYEIEPIFRHAIDVSCEQFKGEIDADFPKALLTVDPKGTPTDVGDNAFYVQFAQFVTSYALAELWKSWGVQPDAVVGYGAGEIVAGLVAGVISLADAVRIIGARSRTMQDLPSAAMVAVGLSEQEVRPLIDNDLALAASNAPRQTIVCGSSREIEALTRVLAERHVSYDALEASQRYHLRMTDSLEAHYREAITELKFRSPQIDFISTATGNRATHEELTSPEYWASEPCRVIRFSQAVETLAAGADQIFLEIGVGEFLSELVRSHPAIDKNHLVLSSCPAGPMRVPNFHSLLQTLGRLWLAGRSIAWQGVYFQEQPTRISLPGYPFEKERHWIEEPVRSQEDTAPESPSLDRILPEGQAKPSVDETDRPAISPASSVERQSPASGSTIEYQVAEVWRQMLGVKDFAIDADFLELGGDSLVAVQMISRIRDLFKVELPMSEFLRSPTVGAMAQSIALLRAQAGHNSGLKDALSKR
jgi:acyl transferase domain-containing protein